MFFLMNRETAERLKPSRTAVTFSLAGIIFSTGYWTIIAALLGKNDEGTEVIGFDSYIFLPGLVALTCMFIVNTFASRQILAEDSPGFFDSDSGNRGTKFLIFTCFSLSLASIGAAVLLGSLVYNSAGKSSLSVAGPVNAFCTTVSAFLIFFGRDLADNDYF